MYLFEALGGTYHEDVGVSQMGLMVQLRRYASAAQHNHMRNMYSVEGGLHSLTGGYEKRVLLEKASRCNENLAYLCGRILRQRLSGMAGPWLGSGRRGSKSWSLVSALTRRLTSPTRLAERRYANSTVLLSTDPITSTLG